MQTFKPIMWSWLSCYLKKTLLHPSWIPCSKYLCQGGVPDIRIVEIIPALLNAQIISVMCRLLWNTGERHLVCCAGMEKESLEEVQCRFRLSAQLIGPRPSSFCCCDSGQIINRVKPVEVPTILTEVQSSGFNPTVGMHKFSCSFP